MRNLPAIALLAVLAACVAPSTPPPAAPRAVPPPAPAPAPPPPAASSDWRDWPVTPGNWAYRASGQGAAAIYGAAGAPAFTIQCEAGGRLALNRAGTSAPLTIRTSSTARTITGPLPAGDQLIDAMGYSRGRFIVETPGMPALVLPAWAEVLRVAEDCRR